MLNGKNDLFLLFNPIYDLKSSSELNLDLKPYSAIIVDNVDAGNLNSYTDKLSTFVSEGNGLLVLGGRESYDSGNYKGSRFEQLLPVSVSRAGRKEGDVNIIFVMDISGSTGALFGKYTKVDVEKALAIKMLNATSLVHNVGVVAFNDYAYEVADLRRLIEHNDLNDKIQKLNFFGGTDMLQGLNLALTMLKDRGGSKNIVILSDGITGNQPNVKNAVSYAASQGIKVYTVGVGSTDTVFMKQLANLGNGIYFEPSLAEHIKLVFGDTELAGDKRVFPLVVVNKDHFITQDLELSANLYGFNQVVPKNTAKMLISTDVGDPILGVWRFGLGRVASIATDYNVYGFELLNQRNSLLLTRTTNWVIGDPERKNPRFVDVSDGRINDFVEIIVKFDVQPKSDLVAFYKFDENLYKGDFYVDKTGFNGIMGALFAVNYESEYQDIGNNPELNTVVSNTGGKLFNFDDTNKIVEFIRQKSIRELFINKTYSWIFLLIALGLYLIEVCVRRLVAFRLI